jgi:predicted RNase H-related nuclease YkuK (DUF458 family)
MNLEKRVEEGGFYYIRMINYDPVRKSLTFEFMKAPEEMSPARRFLVFEDVEDYSVKVDTDSAIEEAEDGVIDSLIALGEYTEGGKMGYAITTEDREFNFRTNTKPRIEDAWQEAI